MYWMSAKPATKFRAIGSRNNTYPLKTTKGLLGEADIQLVTRSVCEEYGDHRGSSLTRRVTICTYLPFALIFSKPRTSLAR